MNGLGYSKKSDIRNKIDKKDNYRYTEEVCEILSNDKIGEGVFDLRLAAPQIAGKAKAGQFVNILCDGKMLRRPISICGFDSKSGVLRLVYEAKGAGTIWMGGLEKGEKLNLVGPLGKGFPIVNSSKKAVLVGGGIGTPPLLPVAEFYKENAAAIIGFRNEKLVILEEDFKSQGATTLVCTDDGSYGLEGFTVKYLKEYLKENDCDVIYTCGPKIMMERVACVARESDILCYVSLEEHMACGVGVCHGCGCKTKKAGEEESTKRICLNGPVFLSSEVIWE